MLRPIADAPRDQSLLRIVFKDGTEVTGYWSRLFLGWTDYYDTCPLIRRDNEIAGWEPIEDQQQVIRAFIERRQRPRKPYRKPTQVIRSR